MWRADQLAPLKQGPPAAESVPPLGQTAGVGPREMNISVTPMKEWGTLFLYDPPPVLGLMVFLLLYLIPYFMQSSCRLGKAPRAQHSPMPPLSNHHLAPTIIPLRSSP